jgi:hypothetical protein
MFIASRKSLIVVAALGIALRLFHYLRNPSVWHDEAALLVNVLNLDFAQMLGPLMWHEASPPGFLWLERAVCLTFGDGTYALRFLPMLASCISVVLFTSTARRLLSPVAAFWAALLFATSDRLLWHACEAKPYAFDVLFATIVLWGMCMTREWPLARRLVAITIVAPFMIVLSFPACFLGGAVLIAVAPAVVRDGLWRTRLLYALSTAAIVGTFAIMYFGPILAQRTGPMEECWTGHFPNWSEPWTVPVWSVVAVFEVARYAIQPIGGALLVLAVAGAVAFWRRRERAWLVLLGGPFALALFAALIKGYPCGGSRLEIFLAPGLAILVAAGAEPLADWLRAKHRRGPLIVFGAMIVPVLFSAWFVVNPWPRADTARAARYILAHKQPNDGLAANHWEYAYYFHRERPDVSWLDRGIPSDAPRVWVAFTSCESDSHRQYAEHLSSLGRIVSRREFTFTTVFLLDRSPSAGPSVAQSMPPHSLP